jgi:hypothetical protein
LGLPEGYQFALREEHLEGAWAAGAVVVVAAVAVAAVGEVRRP